MSERRGETEQGRPGLSRDTIVDAALAFIDEEGLSALTMRRLGARLGVEAMALYHYVNGREDLLDALVDAVLAEVRIPPTESLGPADGWQAYVQEFAAVVRSVAIAHPQLFPLVATRPPEAPWLRPPLRSLEMVEDFLEALTVRGLSDSDAAHIYQVFAAFLLGQLLLEVIMRGVQITPEDDCEESNAGRAGPDPQRFPVVTRLGPRLGAYSPDAEFEDALEALLVRLDHELDVGS